MTVSTMFEGRWELTVVRVQGLRLMLPVKSWRPIVSVEVDKHVHHETILGVDGQNPNLKCGLQCFDVQQTSIVSMKVWYAASSKKSGKRRLVAAASHTLGDLFQTLKMTQAVRSKARHAEVRLTCQTGNTRRNSTSSKGRPQNGAVLTLKISGPSVSTNEVVDTSNTPNASETALQSSRSSAMSPANDSEDGGYSSSSGTGLRHDATPLARTPPQPDSGLLRRRPKKSKKHLQRYLIFSDEDRYEHSHSGCDESVASVGSQSSSRLLRPSTTTLTFEDAIRSDPLESCFDNDSDGESIPHLQDGVITFASNQVPRWVAASLLPQHIMEPHKPRVPPYTERIEVFEPISSQIRWWERVVASFTMYMELRDARTDSEFDLAFARMRMEWTFIGTLLAGLAAVSTTVLSISPDSTIPLTPLALQAIACSSIFTGLGIAATAYFILRYSFSPVSLFRMRALDVYGSYVFFSISARVPTLCMVASALGLMSFLGLVAFELWPRGVVVVSFMVGVVMSLQFLIYGFHQLGRGLMGGSRRVARAGQGIVRHLTGVPDSQSTVLTSTPAQKITQKTVGPQ